MGDLAPWAVVLPLLAAAVMLIIGRRVPRWAADGFALATAAAAVGLTAVLAAAARSASCWWPTRWAPGWPAWPPR
jgi:multicomponent Na+:H+ antiporter subunit D